jgi:Survival protein SurE
MKGAAHRGAGDSMTAGLVGPGSRPGRGATARSRRGDAQQHPARAGDRRTRTDRAARPPDRGPTCPRDLCSLMRALITNEGGIDSTGLHALTRIAVAAGLELTVVAPHVERSGSSVALSALQAHGGLVVEDRVLAGLPGIPAVEAQASIALIPLAISGSQARRRSRRPHRLGRRPLRPADTRPTAHDGLRPGAPPPGRGERRAGVWVAPSPCGTISLAGCVTRCALGCRGFPRSTGRLRWPGRGSR